MKIFQGGMKRWVTKYSGVDYSCTECHKYYSRKKRRGIKSKYGHGLICWMVYQNIANGMSGGQIKRILDDAFALPVRAELLSDYFRPAMATYHKTTYHHILRTILAGNLIFADETQINYRDGSGYVWVIASMEDIYYVFTETREGDFLKKLLKKFNGVLISDFYAAYNSITCAQQKCLIHLIRDLFSRTTLKEFLILLSVWQTCKSKGINFLNFLCSRQQDIDLYQNSPSSEATVSHRKI